MRARQLAAAEQRANNAANRGIGNQAKVQQWQKRQEAIEEMEAKAGKSPQNNDNPLRVSTAGVTYVLVSSQLDDYIHIDLFDSLSKGFL